MYTIGRTAAPARSGLLTLVRAKARGETALAGVALGVVGLHVADDNFLQPNPGMSAADHLAGGLVLLALVAAAGLLYGRVRAGARGAIALAAGFLGVLVSTEAVYYATEVGPSGDDYTGLLALPAGLVLLALGARTLWRSRKTGDRLWRRYGRRALLAVAVVLGAELVLVPVAQIYVVTHAAHATVPPADLGARYEDVELTTSDGLRLRGWYVPSRNGAAVIAFPGRAAAQTRAKLLARHGYGVLLFDRRGEGESDGDPNILGWHGERDVHAALRFLQSRPDVDPARIGGIGLSVGGETMIEAAAESTALRAIVSEGASARSVRDLLANPDSPLVVVVVNAVGTAATALFTSDLPPRTLRSLVPEIEGAALFVYGEHGQWSERPANTTFYAEARGERELWEVPGSGHVGGLDARPAEYERRVVGFFDRTLAGG